MVSLPQAAAGASEQLAALGVDLSKVPDQQGSLVCDLEGNVVEVRPCPVWDARMCAAVTRRSLSPTASRRLEHLHRLLESWREPRARLWRQRCFKCCR